MREVIIANRRGRKKKEKKRKISDSQKVINNLIRKFKTRLYRV